MRTIEEVKEYVKDKWQELEDGLGRGNGPHCQGCLYALLEFIDSPPPCEHKRVIFFDAKKSSPQTAAYQTGWYIWGQVGDASRQIKFCPECGAELEAKK